MVFHKHTQKITLRVCGYRVPKGLARLVQLPAETANTFPFLLQFLIFSSHNTYLSCSSLLISKTRGHRGQELAAMIKYINTDVKKLIHGLLFGAETQTDSSPMHSGSLLQSLLKQKEVRACLKGSCVVQVHDLNFCCLDRS